MKRINACASDAQLSFDLSNSLLTPSFHNSHLRNKFKLTPIAVACVCALCSLSANATTPPSGNLTVENLTTEEQLDALDVVSGKDGNKLYTIGGTIDLSKIDQGEFNKNLADDLIGFFREDGEKHDADPARVYIGRESTNNWIYLADNPFYSKGDDGFFEAGDKVGENDLQSDRANAVVHFYNGTNNDPWEVKYDFSNDGGPTAEEPNSYDTSVLSFFENESISINLLNGLKFYIFHPEVNLLSRNHLVATTNSGDSNADIGLSLSNKRKNITFNEKVNFISTFSFYDNGTGGGDTATSGVEGLRIAAGVYNAFGASNANIQDEGKNIFSLLFREGTTELTAYGESLGVLTFNEYATISVTHKVREQYPEPNDEQNEVFGVLNNEGGTTVFNNGSDIIVKGSSTDKIVSAITASATKGILDPLKQGTIIVNSSNNKNVTTRIWGLAEIRDSNNLLTPFTDENFDNFNINSDYKNYLDKINTSNNIELRTALLSAHGSSIKIDDSNGGNIDIRGDIISGMLNGSGANSNTVGHNAEKTKNGANLKGTVVRSSIDINLSNSSSVLYGNIYERHRITDDEVVDNSYNGGKSFSQNSFELWLNKQLEEESQSLGGNIDLSLSNEATWYPQKNWKGWNNDFVYDDFNKCIEQINSIIPDKIDYSDQINKLTYSKIDFSDQYNLKIYEHENPEADEKGYVLVNNKYKDGGKEQSYSDPTKINDLDLEDMKLDPESGIKYAFEKAGIYTTVDNGIYHLALNDGGVVDTRYMRQGFNFSTVNDVIGNNMDYSLLDKGIKKLRIQELAGNGGTFNIFVENNDNHDLIIIDQAKENSSPTISFNIFNIWNGENNTDKNLGIIKGDESTFVQIGRVGKDIQFNKTIEIEPQYGDIQKITYTIEKDNENFDWTTEQRLEYHEAMNNLFITDYKFETAPEIIEGARMSSSLAYNYAIMDIDRLQKRRGEARYITQQDDGMWARYRHINSGLSGNDDSADVIQIGYDHKVRNEESYNVYSVAVDYLRGQSDFDQSGDSEMNRYSLAVYDTWLLDNGAYLDLTARVGYFDAEMNTSFRMPSNTFYNVDGDYNFWGASVGAEIGRKFSNKDQWFFEPQTQLTYTYIGGYDFNTSQGVKVESDSIDSVIMRWGLRVGKDFGTSAKDGLYSVYLMADALHDFLGQQELTVTGMSTGNSHVAKFDGEQTWYDVGIGFSCTLNENSYIFLNYERSLGHSIDNTWEANAGVSVVF